MHNFSYCAEISYMLYRRNAQMSTCATMYFTRTTHPAHSFFNTVGNRHGRISKIETSPYSPDLAPMDFKVFPEVKSHLRGHRFGSTQDLVTETMKVVSSFDEKFYLDIFNKWVHRHRKCVRTGGGYIEKV